MFYKLNLKLLLAIFLLISAASGAKAANAVVTITGDPDDTMGNCATQGGACSLRQAINYIGVGDSIFFDIPAASCPNNVCTINLTRGTLNLVKPLSIFGTGARNLIVQRSTAQGTPAFGIFAVGQVIPITVNISGIAISNGLIPVMGGAGGGIFNGIASSLTLNNVSVTGNGADIGGGVINYDGTLTMIDSLVANNTSNSGASGVFNLGGTATIVNSTVSGNSSNSGVGGISNQTDQNRLATLSLINSTISNNSSAQYSGGVGNDSISGAATNVRNTIIAGNTAPPPFGDVGGTFLSRGNNLVGTAPPGTGFGIVGSNDIVLGNQPSLLAPLANNGGQIDTHALLPNSPAINAGNNCVTTRSCASDNPPPNINFEYDQRSQPFARKVGAAVDIGAFELQPPHKSAFDFDGDGKADVSVFRPSAGAWYLQESQNGFVGAAFGISTDRIVPADYDGDGKTDIAVYRDGTWYIQRSSLGFIGIYFGAATDIPVPADFDADGRAELAVFRPSTGVWYVYNFTTNQLASLAFGIGTDKPVPADYDGDGKADIAVYRAGVWYIRQSSLGFTGVSFGAATDIPVPADYDGDGKTDIAVYRPSTGTWYLQRSAAGFAGIAFGTATDLPVPADYDGDGKTDEAVTRANGGSLTWYLLRSQSGFTGVGFGASADKAVESAYIQ